MLITMCKISNEWNIEFYKMLIKNYKYYFYPQVLTYLKV